MFCRRTVVTICFVILLAKKIAGMSSSLNFTILNTYSLNDTMAIPPGSSVNYSKPAYFMISAFNEPFPPIEEKRQLNLSTTFPNMSSLATSNIVLKFPNAIQDYFVFKFTLTLYLNFYGQTNPRTICDSTVFAVSPQTHEGTVDCEGIIVTYSQSYACEKPAYGLQCIECHNVNTTEQCYSCNTTDGSHECCSSAFDPNRNCFLFPTTQPTQPSTVSSTGTTSSVSVSPTPTSTISSSNHTFSSTHTTTSVSTDNRDRDLKIFKYTTYGLAGLAGLFLLTLLILCICCCRYYKKSKKESNPYLDPARFRNTSPNMVYTVPQSREDGGYYKPPSVTSSDPETPPPNHARLQNVRDSREEELLNALYSQPIPRSQRNQPQLDSSMDTELGEGGYAVLPAPSSTTYQSAPSQATTEPRGEPPPYRFRNSAPEQHPVTYV